MNTNMSDTKVFIMHYSILTERKKNILNELDNMDDKSTFVKQSRKGSSTLHVAESYNPTANYTSTLTIPTFDNQLLYLKPRAVIRFTSAAHTYEFTYGIKVNLSRYFK